MTLALSCAILLVLAGCGTVIPLTDSDASSEGCESICGKNSSCIDSSCICDEGFDGQGADCVAIISCNTDNGGCDVNASCSGSADAIVCECNAGFIGDGISCDDIDECLTNNGGCAASANCTNSSGDHSCDCPTGEFGDGLECRAVWNLVGTLPNVNLAREGWRPAITATNSEIFFAPTTGDSNVLFMRSFDVATAQFKGPHSVPTGNTDFCACGLTEVFLSDGDDLFLMGNYGLRYSVDLDQWSTLPSYEVVRRGEAAGTYDALSNLFLMIGGRNAGSTAMNMSYSQTAGAIFNNEPGTLPLSMDHAVAHTLVGTTTTYVAAGDLNEGVALLSHTTGDNVWSVLSPAPGYIGRAAGMGQFDGKLWVARDDGNFAFYDPGTSAWAEHNIQPPQGFLAATMVQTDTYVIAQEGLDVMIYQLNAIE